MKNIGTYAIFLYISDNILHLYFHSSTMKLYRVCIWEDIVKYLNTVVNNCIHTCELNYDVWEFRSG